MLSVYVIVRLNQTVIWITQKKNQKKQIYYTQNTQIDSKTEHIPQSMIHDNFLDEWTWNDEGEGEVMVEWTWEKREVVMKQMWSWSSEVQNIFCPSKTSAQEIWVGFEISFEINCHLDASFILIGKVFFI